MLNRREFFKRLKMMKDIGEYTFHTTIGNNEYTDSGWQRRTSEFSLWLVTQSGSIQLYYKRTGKDVYQLKADLIEQYTRWANQFLLKEVKHGKTV